MAVATTRFSGRAFSAQEVTLIREVVRDCSGLSRMELARTVCELLPWRRPNGRLKARECREFLERLDADGTLVLPAKRRGRAVGSVTRVPRTGAGEPGRPLLGSVRPVEPLRVELVREPVQRLLFRELVGRYHYLEHKVPFGAHLRYLVFASRPVRAVVGCLQFYSPAWRMAARDRWIGWDDRTRARNLQRVVNNNRFLLLPWVAVKNLASTVLARGLGQLVADWPRHYRLDPWLVETIASPSPAPSRTASPYPEPKRTAAPAPEPTTRRLIARLPDSLYAATSRPSVSTTSSGRPFRTTTVIPDAARRRRGPRSAETGPGRAPTPSRAARAAAGPPGAAQAQPQRAHPTPQGEPPPRPDPSDRLLDTPNVLVFIDRDAVDERASPQTSSAVSNGTSRPPPAPRASGGTDQDAATPFASSTSRATVVSTDTDGTERPETAACWSRAARAADRHGPDTATAPARQRPSRARPASARRTRSTRPPSGPAPRGLRA